jgi:hypothetical protein
MDYRLYLFGADNSISAAQNMGAENDAEATETGAVLFGAVSDTFSRHEVWCGARYVVARPASAPRTSLAELEERRQASAVEMELIMASSFASVRRSRQLLAETEHLLGNPHARAIHELVAARGKSRTPISDR